MRSAGRGGSRRSRPATTHNSAANGIRNAFLHVAGLRRAGKLLVGGVDFAFRLGVGFAFFHEARLRRAGELLVGGIRCAACKSTGGHQRKRGGENDGLHDFLLMSPGGGPVAATGHQLTPTRMNIPRRCAGNPNCYFAAATGAPALAAGRRLAPNRARARSISTTQKPRPSTNQPGRTESSIVRSMSNADCSTIHGDTLKAIDMPTASPRNVRTDTATVNTASIQAGGSVRLLRPFISSR